MIMSLSDVIKSLEDKFSFKKKAIVSGISFEISLLNYEQDQLISSFPDEGDDPLSYYERTRAQVLSYAITCIDGEVIPDIVEVKEENSTVTKEKSIYVKEILKKVPPKIVEKLFEVYIDFKDETDNKLDNDVEFEWYKTPEQRKKERDAKEEEEKRDKVDSSEEETSEDPTSEDKTLSEKPIVFTELSVKDDETDPVE